MAVEPEPKIVLIPQIPPDMMLDFVFRTDRGVAVQASAEDIAGMEARGIPFVELFSSGNEYASVMFNSSSSLEALAAIESVQDSRLAQLPSDQRNQFGLA